ncbi:hypothetical protein [Leifsonia sp. NCR5]|uniref:hypothetical protein n=1 Tax=Leifsonia sp. NCR5 TaxID=1978342 RepID=UPI00117B974D|nr:hypothetical protein [Leifsonia sp. NCR5]
MFTIASLAVVFALLLAHMFESAHAAGPAAATAPSIASVMTDPGLSDAESTVAASAEDGVPPDQMLVLDCVLAVAAALAGALLVVLLRRDFFVAMIRVISVCVAIPAFPRSMKPSLEALAISRT